MSTGSPLYGLLAWMPEWCQMVKFLKLRYAAEVVYNEGLLSASSDIERSLVRDDRFKRLERVSAWGSPCVSFCSSVQHSTQWVPMLFKCFTSVVCSRC